MDPIAALLKAVEALDAELPALVGEEWPEVKARLAGFVGQLETDPSSGALVRARILALLSRYPLAYSRLLELLEEGDGRIVCRKRDRAVARDGAAGSGTSRECDTLHGHRVPGAGLGGDAAGVGHCATDGAAAGIQRGGGGAGAAGGAAGARADQRAGVRGAERGGAGDADRAGGGQSRGWCSICGRGRWGRRGCRWTSCRGAIRRAR